MERDVAAPLASATRLAAVALASDGVIKLCNRGGSLSINRKTGAMDLLTGGSRTVYWIACRKHDSSMPIPKDEPPADTV